ncbi:Phosphatidylserine synthase 2 [Clonorchis sinensis]|uniref:Phosphatidylserine synthase n=1 Tax=Clonorchis sinensis TaxID=79923 RepID=A0A8T1LX83_CLOSI|nr:Phosphatidylserine synthase 2 [Clonorchis sinensis]
MRRRLFSESQIEKDYFLSNIEQHKVENITISAFYQSRSLTVLACIWLGLATVACYRSSSFSLEQNLFHGFLAVFVIFLFVSVMIMPNGPFTRPHPAVWRVVFGASLFYFFALVLTVFLRLEEARQIIIWLYPELKHMKHCHILDKEYAVNCSQVTFERVYSHMDIFALAHFAGWVVKTILLRHRMIAWTLSINWEITEIAFSHILPNFNECWWDSLLLDVLICNGLGIEVGMLLCRWLEIRDYRWDSIRDIRGARGKLKRAVLQFTPGSWTYTRWLHRDSSVLRSFLLSQLIIVWQLAELNSFFLKHVFIVKPSHPLTQLRLLLITLMSAPAIRQYYLYVIDPHVKRVGSQLWLFIATVLTETLVCFKLGSETFEHAILWNLVYWVIWMILSSFLTVWICRYLFAPGSGTPPTANTPTIPQARPTQSTIEALTSFKLEPTQFAGKDCENGSVSPSAVSIRQRPTVQYER